MYICSFVIRSLCCTYMPAVDCAIYMCLFVCCADLDIWCGNCPATGLGLRFVWLKRIPV